MGFPNLFFTADVPEKRRTLLNWTMGLTLTKGDGMNAIALALFLMFLQRPDAATPTPVLVVNGSAQVLVAPDEATVRLGIVRQAATAQAAQEQASAVAKRFSAPLRKSVYHRHKFRQHD